MVKITKKMGTWQGRSAKIPLYYEECSNPACSAGTVHYPLDMDGPYCPDCRTKLIGGVISNNIKCRIGYHLPDYKEPSVLGVTGI